MVGGGDGRRVWGCMSRRGRERVRGVGERGRERELLNRMSSFIRMICYDDLFGDSSNGHT